MVANKHSFDIHIPVDFQMYALYIQVDIKIFIQVVHHLFSDEGLGGG